MELIVLSRKLLKNKHMKFEIKLITFYVIITFLLGANTEAQNIITIAGNGVSGYTGDGGLAINAQLYEPNQLAFDQAGNLFIAEDRNNIIRKIDITGHISTVAGNGTSGFSGDGGLATSAQLDRACGVAVDAAGNIYICDADNFRIRKVNTSGIISTIAGNGTEGYSGDGGPATSAEIGFTSGICVDATGNLYFASQNSNVRKVNTSGIISTYAGNGINGSSGDGGLATSAQIKTPASVFLDGAGNLYIGDLGGMKIRKVNAAGYISTFAGNGSASSGGDGGQATNAQLYYPYGVVVDSANNVYICESGYNKIRKVNSSGIISTFAGIGGYIAGYSGDGGPAINAQFYHPSAITLNSSGNIYIGDYENNVIRKITINVGIDDTYYTNEFSLFPNPCNDIFTVESENMEIKTIQIIDVMGQIVFKKTFQNYETKIDISYLKNGIYFVKINNGKSFSIQKLVKE
jgi:trimeric autotransporter adhesin